MGGWIVVRDEDVLWNVDMVLRDCDLTPMVDQMAVTRIEVQKNVA